MSRPLKDVQRACVRAVRINRITAGMYKLVHEPEVGGYVMHANDRRVDLLRRRHQLILSIYVLVGTGMIGGNCGTRSWRFTIR